MWDSRCGPAIPEEEGIETPERNASTHSFLTCGPAIPEEEGIETTQPN